MDYFFKNLCKLLILRKKITVAQKLVNWATLPARKISLFASQCRFL